MVINYASKCIIYDHSNVCSKGHRFWPSHLMVNSLSVDKSLILNVSRTNGIRANDVTPIFPRRMGETRRQSFAAVKSSNRREKVISTHPSKTLSKLQFKIVLEKPLCDNNIWSNGTCSNDIFSNCLCLNDICSDGKYCCNGI